MKLLFVFSLCVAIFCAEVEPLVVQLGVILDMMKDIGAYKETVGDYAAIHEAYCKFFNQDDDYVDFKTSLMDFYGSKSASFEKVEGKEDVVEMLTNKYEEIWEILAAQIYESDTDSSRLYYYVVYPRIVAGYRQDLKSLATMFSSLVEKLNQLTTQFVQVIEAPFDFRKQLNITDYLDLHSALEKIEEFFAPENVLPIFHEAMQSMNPEKVEKKEQLIEVYKRIFAEFQETVELLLFNRNELDGAKQWMDYPDCHANDGNLTIELFRVFNEMNYEFEDSGDTTDQE